MPIGGGFCRWSSRGATKTFVRNQTSNTTTYALGKGTGMIPGRDLASSQYRALPRERLGLCNDRPPGLSHPGFRTITIARKSPLVGLLRDKYVYPRRQPITSDHWQSEISARAHTHTHHTSPSRQLTVTASQRDPARENHLFSEPSTPVFLFFPPLRPFRCSRLSHQARAHHRAPQRNAPSSHIIIIISLSADEHLSALTHHSVASRAPFHRQSFPFFFR
jgi:hypothetical protein